MSENPDVIRADIEATRSRLGTNVDALADKVTPSHIVQRQSDKVKDAVFGVKDKVMGAADHSGNSLQDAGSALGDAPSQVRSKTQGNPLAAGLIAFGAGLLLSSLIPASQQEREAVDALKTAAEPLTTELTGAAKDMAEGLKEPAQEAMEHLKATATDGVENVKAESQDAAAEVKDKASDARDNVQQA
ncbi:DUF3618 domain-containing protein [Paeniglutamicibacter antarcticus]|uniref:DUF3618 domain-containing protein n=1 Tax=Paeniglutamicibacter antarcticus TaxID=494023 RepID=A0ABP9TJ04_9MICC